MRVLFPVLFWVLAPISGSTEHFDDETFWERRQQVFQVFEGLQDKLPLLQSLLDIFGNFNPLENLNNFINPETVQRYFEGVKGGRYLNRKEHFNKFDAPSLIQAIELFEILFFAPDWDTLMKTAVAAREYTNPEQFFYSFATALLHRDSPRRFDITPPHQVFPNLFPSGDHEQHQKSNHVLEGSECAKEQKMSYFYNDPRLNSQIMMQNMKWPSWWDSKKYGKALARQGEQFWNMNNQLIKRIDLERKLNGLSPMKPLDWNEFDIPRESPVNMHVAELLGYEARLKEAIKNDNIVDENDYKLTSLKDARGISRLANNINGKPNTLNPSLNDRGHHLLQAVHSLHKNYSCPGLHNLMTYRYYKRLDNIFQQHKATLTPYTENELRSNGISITYVKLRNLTSNISDTKVSIDNKDLTNSRSNKRQVTGFLPNIPMCLEIGVEGRDIGRPELHLYTFKQLYDREIQQHGEIFCLDPEFKCYCQPNETYVLQRTYELRMKEGNNTLHFNFLQAEQNRTGAIYTCNFYPDIESTNNGSTSNGTSRAEILPIHNDEEYVPNDLVLPINYHLDRPLNLFLMITNFKEDSLLDGTAKRKTFDQPMGFPFDRKIVNKNLFRQPNMFYLNNI